MRHSIRLLGLAASASLTTSTALSVLALPGSAQVMSPAQSDEQTEAEEGLLLQAEGTLEASDEVISLGDGEEPRRFDGYSVELAAGEAVVVSLSSDAFNSVLFLFSTDRLVAFNDDSDHRSTDSSIAIAAPETGTYRIMVTSKESRDQMGDYALTVRRTQPDDVALQQFEANDLNRQGQQHLNSNQTAEALERFERALIISRGVDYEYGESEALNGLGLVYSSLSDYGKALEYYQRALTIRQGLGYRFGEGASLQNIAGIYNKLDQYPEALDYYGQALDIFQELGSPARGVVLNDICSVHLKSGQYTEALDFCQRALVILDETNNRRLQGTALNNIGSIYYALSRYPEALDYSQQALAIRQNIGDRRGEASSLSNIGSIYESLGEYSQALEYVQQALSIQRDIGDRRGEASSLGGLAGIYFYLSDYANSLENHRQALALNRDIGNRFGESANLLDIGFVRLRTGDYRQAINSLEGSLAISRDIGNVRGEALALGGLGQAYDSLSDYARALDVYQQSVAIFQTVGARQSEASALASIGTTQYKLSDYAEALASYSQALDIYREIDNLDGIGATLLSMGSVYFSRSDYDKALELYQQSRDIYGSIGDQYRIAEAVSAIAGVYNIKDAYPVSLDLHEQALAIRDRIGDKNGAAASLISIGDIRFTQGNYAKALELYERALMVYRDIGNRSGEASALSSIGGVRLALSEYADALEAFEAALALRQDIGSRSGIARSLTNIGNVYSFLGDNTQSKAFYEQSLTLREDLGDRLGIGILLNNIGYSYHVQDDYAEALQFYERALAVYQDVGVRLEAATTLNNIGRTYQDLGEYDQALGFLNRALAISQDIDSTSSQALVLGNIGRTYFATGDYANALDFLEQALILNQDLGKRNRSAEMLGVLGEVFAAQDQSELGIVFLKRSVNLYEAIRKDLGSLNADLQSAYADSIADTYRTLADLLLQQDRILEAQRVLDLLKVQELDEYLDTVRGTPETASGIDYRQPEQEILQRYQRLQESAIELSQELAQLNDKKTASTITPEEEARRLELDELQDELTRQFDDFIYSEDVQALLDSLSRAELQQSVALEDLSGLRDNLGRLNAAILYPLILDDRLELVITTPTSEPLRRTIESVGREQLNAAVTEFRQALQTPTTDAVTPAQQLYRWLIAPIEADLAAAGVETIIYSPDGALRYIPLAALHDGEQWLAERFRINNITARSLTELDTLPQNEPRVLAGAFADASISYAVKGQNYAGLPFAGREVATLDETLSEITAFFDQEFDLEVIEAEIARFNILHFATHAAFVAGNPDESFILFGDGDAPTLRDIGQWQLFNIDLVVLSACETGLGGFDNNGAQVLGLGYQFQQRGAKAVVASLWQVSDGGTQALMNAFYGALNQGMSKSEALRQAQIALIEDDFAAVGGQRGGIELISTATGEPLSRDNLDHPYYWASFILIGNGL